MTGYLGSSKLAEKYESAIDRSPEAQAEGERQAERFHGEQRAREVAERASTHGKDW
jgi:hypothetical protein